MVKKDPKIIGRRGCPLCGFESAHIKQTEGKLPYQHCPGCGIQLITKNQHQASLLTANMRPEPNYTEQAQKAQAFVATGAATDGPQPPAAAEPIVVRSGVPVVAKTKTPPPDPVAQAKPQNWASALLGGVH